MHVKIIALGFIAATSWFPKQLIASSEQFQRECHKAHSAINIVYP
jgi:hypothetical protein